MNTIDATDRAVQSEVAEKARQYVALRNELMDRGKELAAALNKRGAGKTFVVNIDGEFYEVAATYAPSFKELPVSVSPAEVL